MGQSTKVSENNQLQTMRKISKKINCIIRGWERTQSNFALFSLFLHENLTGELPPPN